MFHYPTLAEASDSFTFLAACVRNPDRFAAQEGGQHVWTAWGFLQGQALGEVRSMSVEDEAAYRAECDAKLQETHPEQIDRAFTALAAQGRGEAAPCALGNGVLIALVGKLVGKLVESGLPQQVFRAVLDKWLKQQLPGAG